MGLGTSEEYRWTSGGRFYSLVTLLFAFLIEMKQPILYIDSNFRLKRYEIVNRTKGKVKHQK